MPEPAEKPNLLFRLLVPAGGLFVVTILALLVSGLVGDPQAPGNRLLDEHGGKLIALEVAAVLLLAVAAMTIDRWRAVRPGRRAGQPDADDRVRRP